ncbi:MAG: DNA/RNA non-specific endonuclease [Bacteroidetes bacterium]|nr:DNA/RNA non-specific endonuclease [Bacteroidota bacterium]
MRKMKAGLIAASLIVILFASCKKDNTVQPNPTPTPTPPTSPTSTTSIIEDFEKGTKTTYPSANVTLNTGSWNLTDALIGTSSSDAKIGSQSARIVNTGTVTMNFDVDSGASTITVYHAVYGTDGASTWGLFASIDGGTTFTQVGGTITSASTVLTPVNFTVNISGKVRFQIQKLSGGANQINIDNITINYYAAISVPDNDHLLLGNPSDAKTSLESGNNFLMIKSYYKLSYNSSRGTPNWVSWHLFTGDLGTANRANNFRPDSTLPPSFYWVTQNDYSGSGFNRGHNCPSADRTSSDEANSSTFLMSNMIPQAPNNNQQPWQRMEDSIRAYVNKGNEAFIQMGSYGVGGVGSNGSANTIAGGNVTVPAFIWKLAVIIPNGNNDLNRIDTSARVIAVIIPNVNAINNLIKSDTTLNTNWKIYRTSVNAIQAATGYSFMPNVPFAIRKVLMAKVDTK